MNRLHWLGVALVGAAAGCSSSSSGTTTTSKDAGRDAVTTVDAGYDGGHEAATFDAGIDANVCPGLEPVCMDSCAVTNMVPASCVDGVWTCQIPPCDAGVADASLFLDASVPTNHRPSGSTCPSQRGSEAPVCANDAGVNSLGACALDTQCTMGTNGRCLEGGPAVCASTCSYDECATDMDCPTHQPCICRSSATDTAPNACAAGSNCQIDSDCGMGGYCSPSPGTGTSCAVSGYFCHTPEDDCLNDVQCGSGSVCVYSSQIGHWECASACTPPP